MSELEIEEILKRNRELEKEVLALKGLEDNKSKAFSNIDNKYLKSLKIVEENFIDDKFTNWLNNNLEISDDK